MTTNTSYTIDDIQVCPLSMIIDGEHVSGDGRETTTRMSPAHGVAVSTIALATEVDVNRAVTSSRCAFDSHWKQMPGVRRARLLHKVSELILHDLEELALCETLESGKPISQARAEVADSAGLWEYAATLARQNHGESHNHLGSDTMAMVVREPVGVIGMITPWNFPLLIASQKLPFALAAGNTAVIKPSEHTSATTVKLAELTLEAGIPPGVVNVVTGAGEVGQHIVDHPDVASVSFTGSTPVGRRLAAQAGGRLKHVELELGGKNPQIITARADLEAAVDAAVFGGYFNVGQCCNAGSRLLVHRDIAEEFNSKLVERISHVVVGDPLDAATQVGAIVSEQQLATIARYIDEGRQAGACTLVGGERITAETGALFFEPTVLTDVTPNMSVASEEIFGPVLSVLTYGSLNEAIEIANGTQFGLSAGIWSENISEALQAARDLRAGTVWVNRWMTGYPELPFGGFASSGLGRELGTQALEQFSELKSIQLQVGPNPTRWVTTSSEVTNVN